MPQSLTRHVYLALFVVAAGAIVYALTSAAGGPQPASRLERFATAELAKLDFSGRGALAPETVFRGPDGEAVTLPAFEGRTVLVNFWATWCGPCERELPHLGALQGARGSEVFEVIAISVDAPDDAAQAHARERLAALTGGQLRYFTAPQGDPAFSLVYEAATSGFPTTVIYDGDSMEVARLAGEADWASGHAVAFVDAVLAGVSD